MTYTELSIISAGLATDAFSASVCEGLKMKTFRFRNVATTVLLFGGFQAFMPIAGSFAGKRFSDKIGEYDNWFAAILLFIIGIKTIYESLKNVPVDEVQNRNSGICHKILLAVATSIDALAFGTVLATQKVHILSAAAMIGTITFMLCLLGVYMGYRSGKYSGKQAGIIGGIVLLLIGIKILFIDK